MCIVILASCKHQHIRVHGNLLQHCNNTLPIDISKMNSFGDLCIFSLVMWDSSSDGGEKCQNTNLYKFGCKYQVSLFQILQCYMNESFHIVMIDR